MGENSTKKRYNKKKEDPLKLEVEIMSVLAIALIAFVGIFVDTPFFKFFDRIYFGLFGFIAYLFPIFFFFLTSFILINKNKKGMKIRCFFIVLLFVNLCLTASAMYNGSYVEIGLNSYKLGAKRRVSGGLIGDNILWGLNKIFGYIVCIILIIAVYIIVITYLSSRSTYGLLKTGIKKGIDRERIRIDKKRAIKAKSAMIKRKEEGKDDIVGKDAYSEWVNRRKKKINKNGPNIINNLKSEEFQYSDTEELISKPVSRKTKEIPLRNEDKKVYINLNSDKQHIDNIEPISLNKIPLNNMSDSGLSKDIINKAKESNRDNVDGVFSYDNELKNSFNTIDNESFSKNDDSLFGKKISELDRDSFGYINTENDFSEEINNDEIIENIVDNNLDKDLNLGGNTNISIDNNDSKSDVNIEDKINNEKTDTSIDSKLELDSSSIFDDNVDNNDIDISNKNEEESNFSNESIIPDVELLERGKGQYKLDDIELFNTQEKLRKTLDSFGVSVKMAGVSVGPTVTRYELIPASGVKVVKIQKLLDDIKLALATSDIRIETPIPGKSAVGIEVPNTQNSTVMLRDLLEDENFVNTKCNIPFAVGKDLDNKTIVEDIEKMPHLLIAGATGSGKSVCINTLIMSILYKLGPDDIKFIMIDPKVVELNVYNGIPHLLTPIVTDPRKAAGALNWAVSEMTRRYNLFAETNVRNLKGYNRYLLEKKKEIMRNSSSYSSDDLKKELDLVKPLPRIVIIVDELADLMMVSAKECEEAICRLTQLARAAGMHLIIATQRPSVNVITGLIKANMPSRIAFSVTSVVDSRTILDMKGAERLLGKGDMLFNPQWLANPIRLQGAFISDKEVERVTDYLRSKSSFEKNDDIENAIISSMNSANTGGSASSDNVEIDELFYEAGKVIIEKQRGSITYLQRMLRIGFNRAARIMDQLAFYDVVGEDDTTKPREILMELEDFNQLCTRLNLI